MPSTKGQLLDKKGKRVSTLKALILSGGKGSRLRPFTYTNAKQLVPIANKPVLFYAIEQLVECGPPPPVKIARDFMGEAPFVLYLGDNFRLGGVKPFVDEFRENGANCQILLHPVNNPQAFGVAELVKGR